MNGKKLVTQFFIIYPFFVILFFVWYGILVIDYYQKNIGHFLPAPDQATPITLISMFVIHALIVVGALIYVTPYVRSTTYLRSFFWGSLYGLVIYGVCSLTNLIHFSGWPLHIALMDSAWGSLNCGFLGIILAFLNKESPL